MKKIGFIGAYDKTDLILNIAKILTTMEKRILVIDSSINQKAKYVVPAIDPTVSYITSFESLGSIRVPVTTIITLIASLRELKSVAIFSASIMLPF